MQEFNSEKLRQTFEHAEPDGMTYRLEFIDNLIAEAETHIDPQNQLSQLALSGIKMYVNLCHEINREVVMIPNTTILGLVDIIDDSNGQLIEIIQYSRPVSLTQIA